MVNKKYTDEELLDYLKKFYEENGRVPKTKDMLIKNGYPSVKVYQYRFGSWNNALKLADLPLNRWHYDENDNRLCCRCTTKIWFKNNPLKLQMYKHKSDSKHRGYGVAPINEGFYGANGHHLWLEDDAFTIFMPEFLHQMHWHSHHKQDTLIAPNVLALDYWVNEEFYNNLYLTGEVDG